MNGRTSLVITSISGPCRILAEYAEKCKQENIDFILIGDVPSPKDFSLEGCEFLGIDDQKKLPYKTAQLLPLRHYARKNIGYLIAEDREKDIIIETDDDNLPRDGFWSKREKNQEASIMEESGWVNIYSFFTDSFIWPRGFPLEYLQETVADITDFPKKVIYTPIQQGLADENPDVDAVYRLVHQLPRSFEKKNTIALGKNTWCPFNSQNTTWFREAFPLMYLPSYCSFRMTDIWRSFIAQRIAWENEWGILFHEPTVWQERNEHNLLKDFADEVPGYLNNAKICQILEDLDLKGGIENIPDNLIRCYRALTEGGYIGKEEMPIVEAWLEDIC
jgi:hypothetical protein